MCCRAASDMADDGVSGNCSRSTPTVSEGSEQDLRRHRVGVPSIGKTTSGGDGDIEPMRQLVAMFGALVAQVSDADGFFVRCLANPQGVMERAAVAVADNDVVCADWKYESEQALVPL
ncbi:DNA-directed RNA polymerase [Actinidia chinensis var. chinensis]|uniref:DNA-directed RNA polymerase n=1 Tax=Actinidia chinensis var. chinensis TaxID=1590841 RepID=A0A2R6QG63_ACTCC|nr:DNA-directed RNA polymerase [Actinidia chinensis var. chinensis]